MSLPVRTFSLALALGLLSSCGGDDDASGSSGSGGDAGSAGSAGSAGNGGGSGALALYRSNKIDKIDLLFMVDNSASMADKQQILAAAVPDLVDRLVSPKCINQDGTEATAGGDGKCPTGSRREFDPVHDIHIGIVSSSLGGHGADTCAPSLQGGYNERQEDMAHLVQRKCADAECGTYAAATTYADKGFLFWDPKQKGAPAGDADASALKSKFADIVKGTGQDGCGFEASLEAWYRFLVDPTPHLKIVATDCSTGEPMEGGPCRGPDGNTDETVLQQRKDFLRPDSLLAVVMLTDENDCSVMEGGQGYLAVKAYSGMSPFHLPRATSACATDPNSPQCTSCGVPGHESDSECQKGGFDEQEDALNLRCYRQKQRFGMDFLYPVRRYVYGLTQPAFKPLPYCDGAGDPRCKEWDAPAFPLGVTNGDLNPVFCPEYEANADGTLNRKACKTVLRDPGLVFFAGIVGVPWQDIATDPNDLRKGYRSAKELGWNKADYQAHNAGKPAAEHKTTPPGVTDSVTVWNHIVGKTDERLTVDQGGIPHLNLQYLQPDPAPSGFPLDPLMIESIDPRTGVNPATNTQLAPPTSANPSANPINGHEWSIAGRNDLQYACNFRLPQPKGCEYGASCDCEPGSEAYKNPLCQDDKGEYGNTQYRAKAYPGRRQLATLRGVELLNPGQAIAASICPSNTEDPAERDYGYRPAIASIVERLRSVLAGTCWGTALQPADDGSVPCAVLEATKYAGDSNTCAPCNEAEGRKAATAEAAAVLSGSPNFKDNDLHCICELIQAPPGPQLDACISSSEDSPSVEGVPVNGWCYVDPSVNPSANDTLVLGCPADAKRMIRFAGASTPQTGSLTFVYCKH